MAARHPWFEGVRSGLPMSIRVLIMIVVGVAIPVVAGLLAYPAIDLVDHTLHWRRVRAETDAAGLVGRLGNLPVAEFERAAARAGLIRSETIKGVVDFAGVQPDGRLRMYGWAIDTHRGDRALTVMLIAPKVAAFAVETSFPRNDVADVFLYPKNYTKAGYDVTFDHKAGCAVAASSPYAIAINEALEYAIIRPSIPVQGC